MTDSKLPGVLASLEQQALRRDPEALNALMAFLPRLYRQDLASQFGQHPGLTATRIAACALAILLDPSRPLPLAKFRELAVDNRTLASIFGASAYGALGAARIAGARWPEGRGAVERAQVPTLLKVATLEVLECLVPHLPEIDARLRFPLLVGCLAENIAISPRQDAARNWLIEHPELLADGEMAPVMAARIAAAWMFCSYADHPRRHEVKSALNAVIRRWLERRLEPAASDAPGVTPPPAPSGPPASAPPALPGLPASRLPVVGVVAERFRSGHAMHRCYAPSLAQLRGRYRVVLFAGPKHVDAETKAVADEVVVIPEHPSRINALVALVRARKPDLMFFPSVGMSFWAIALANLRLAPIQLMSIGHPASAFSDCIDYMVIGRDIVGTDPNVYNERVVVREAAGNPIQPHHQYRPQSAPPRERPDTLRIAVPAKSMKLSPRFIALCRRLQRQAGRTLQFHFFPNIEGVFHAQLAARLPAILPGSVVHLPVAYPEYMQRLAACDIALATFPFGNANSTVDALLLGRPVVAMKGDEPSALTDTRMMRLATAPEWLVAGDEPEYEQTALRLIRDDALRVEVSHAILAADPFRALYEAEHEAFPNDFADTLDWLRASHEHLQRSDRRIWYPEDRHLARAPAGAPTA